MLVGICLWQVFNPVMLKSSSKKYDLEDRLFTDHFGIPQYHLSTRYGDLFAGTLSRLIYWLVLWVSPPYSFTLTSGIVGNFSLFDNKLFSIAHELHFDSN